MLKHLDAKVVQRLGTAMAQLKSGLARGSLRGRRRFRADRWTSQADIKVGSDDYIRKVLTDALGDDKANGIIDRILVGRKSKGLDVLKWMDPRAIAEIVRQEHPQVLAIVISYLDPDLSAKVLAELPQWLQSEVLLRVAQLDGVQPDGAGQARRDDREADRRQGRAASRPTSAAPKSAASILNFMPATTLEELRKVDEAMAQKLQDLMFVFDDMLTVDDKGIQSVLREVDSARLVVALKGADPALVQHFLKNMSQRAAEMLKDDLEVAWPGEALGSGGGAEGNPAPSPASWLMPARSCSVAVAVRPTYERRARTRTRSTPCCNGVDSGAVDTAPRPVDDPAVARDYDFSTQTRIVRGRMPTLEMINERLARPLRLSLFSMLRRSPEISVLGISTPKYAEYVPDAAACRPAST